MEKQIYVMDEIVIDGKQMIDKWMINKPTVTTIALITT